MPYADKEMQRDYNREWTRRERQDPRFYDGQCEAAVGGPFFWRCWNRGLRNEAGRVLCGTHRNRIVAGMYYDNVPDRSVERGT